MADTFKALVATETDGKASVAFRDLTLGDLPPGDVVVRVAYSGLNYKDGLVLNGNKGKVVRKFPMVPGIDLAGTVEDSASPLYRKGDVVAATGWGLSETEWGGYTQKARLKAEWLVPLPPGIDVKRAMAIGTAGFTAMLAVMALEDAKVKPGKLPVLVTGAAGGVGSVAVALLAKLGFSVTAATGRADQQDYLKSLGATAFVDRAQLATAGRPLDKELYAGAVDAVGSQILATVLTQITRGGAVATCGNAAGIDLPTSVLPFILRGVALLGVDSVFCAAERRREAWRRLAKDLPLDKLDAMTEVVPFGALLDRAGAILRGQVRGRTVVDVNA